MKQYTLLLAFGLTLSTQLHAQDDSQVIVDAPVQKIFVPSGFDDNDNVEVVLKGEFPDACHHVGTATARIDAAKRQILIQATAIYNPDEACLQAVTPFIQTVPVGQLAEGNYEVVYTKTEGIKAGLDVARRKTESPDDFLYATVEEASITVDPTSGKQALLLSGHFPHYFIGCMVIRDVRVVKDPVDVLVVQPIAELVNTDECDSQPVDGFFTYTAGLSEPFLGEGLIHVRTLNGNAINRFIDIR